MIHVQGALGREEQDWNLGVRCDLDIDLVVGRRDVFRGASCPPVRKNRPLVLDHVHIGPQPLIGNEEDDDVFVRISCGCRTLATASGHLLARHRYGTMALQTELHQKGVYGRVSKSLVDDGVRHGVSTYVVLVWSIRVETRGRACGLLPRHRHRDFGDGVGWALARDFEHCAG